MRYHTESCEKGRNQRLWNMKKVSRIHSNFALGMFAKGFEKPIYELGLNTRFEMIQKKALLHIACIVRKLLLL